MLIEISHQNAAGGVNVFRHDVGLPAFLKHAAIAGQGPRAAILPTVSRGLGLLLYYWAYLRIDPGFHLAGFRRPLLNDPTELGQFSNIVGRALSDRLAKLVCNATFTFTYEAAHQIFVGGLPTGEHPDFYCSSPSGPFAIESKGRAFTSATAAAALMIQAKAQAAASPNIAIAYCYGSVAFSLYDVPKCLFFDPIVEDAGPHRAQEQALMRRYYQTILNDQILQEAPRVLINERSYWAVRSGAPGAGFELLVDTAILDFARRNILEEMPEFPRFESELLYLDSDGLGARIF